MIVSLLPLLAALAAVAATAPARPPTAYSSAFRLVVRELPGATPPPRPINGSYVAIVRAGADLHYVVPTKPGASADGIVLYANGTTATQGTVGSGFDNTAVGWRLEGDGDGDGRYAVVMRRGPGTYGVGVVENAGGELVLGPGGGRYLVCGEPVPGGLAVEYVTGSEVPGKCRVVELVPECATLTDVPPGFYRPPPSKCYTKVHV